GLVALWREALLAQSVLRNRTTGYRHHPQLLRFREQARPVACINSYLAVVHEEAVRRGYRFDASKIGRARAESLLPETAGQLAYEWKHLKRKLAHRRPALARQLRSVRRPEPNPLFHIVPGRVRDWEKARAGV
ncbi:MAG TPA: pyrimidine dimer DNA glycosylase/endonuclease V, partial [Thermoanaerobaculia bacterium]